MLISTVKGVLLSQATTTSPNLKSPMTPDELSRASEADRDRKGPIIRSPVVRRIGASGRTRPRSEMGSGESSASGGSGSEQRLRGATAPSESTIQEIGRPATPAPAAGGNVKRWNTIGISSGRKSPFATNRPPLTHQATMSGALITLAGAQAANARDTGKATVAVIRRKSGGELPFAVRSIGVYCGEHSDRYTVQHLVGHVEPEAAAAGLREGDLITHIDGESVAGLLHTQLVRRLCVSASANATLTSASETSELRVTTVPIERLGIRRGARRRAGGMSKLVTPAHAGSTSLRSQASRGGCSARVSSPAPGSGPGPSAGQSFARKYEPRKKGALASSLLRRVSQKRAVATPPPLSKLACPVSPSSLSPSSYPYAAAASASAPNTASTVQSAVVLLASSPTGRRLYSRDELSSTGSTDSPAPASPLISTTSSISIPDSPLLVSVVGAARKLLQQTSAASTTSSGGEWSQSGSGDFSPANSAFGSPVVRPRTTSGHAASGHSFHQATSPLAVPPTPRGIGNAVPSPFCYSSTTTASAVAGVQHEESKTSGCEAKAEINVETMPDSSVSVSTSTVPKRADPSPTQAATMAPPPTRPSEAPPRPPSTLALAPPTYHHHHHHHHHQHHQHTQHQRPLPSPLGLSTQSNAEAAFAAGAVPQVPPTPLVRRRSLQSPHLKLNYSCSSGTLQLEMTREETKSVQEKNQSND